MDAPPLIRPRAAAGRTGPARDSADGAGLGGADADAAGAVFGRVAATRPPEVAAVPTAHDPGTADSGAAGPVPGWVAWSGGAADSARATR
ncbi:hypothetical protein ACIQGZ_15805 [Streptomyces sp. NPDC092296]|uniref:hypothetical protein n=1 Tax=Streptomyces sp. NPDC092296 TaxID=3366012 RepID=UPI00381CACCA